MDDGIPTSKIPLARAQRIQGEPGMTRAIVHLPDGKYVMFSEGGGGQPSRIILQFENMADMHKAMIELSNSIHYQKES